VAIVAFAYVALPLLYILSASLNPVGSITSTTIIPMTISMENFTSLFTDPARPFALWARNTVIVAVVVVTIHLLVSSMAAYAFSRLRFRGRRSGLIALVLVQMFPQLVAVVAIYRMFSSIGEVMPAFGLDSLAGYIVVLLGGSVGQVLLLKGAFDAIPHEIDEAALLDGASHLRIFFGITLPLARPILVVTSLLVMVGVVGEFLLASVVLRSTAVKTLAVGMHAVLVGDKANNLGWFSAASILVALPVVLIFLYLQRHIVGGLTAGGVKS